MRALCFVLCLAASSPALAAGSAIPTVGAPVLVDALPPAPSLEARLEDIRRRVQAALRYPALARAREISGDVQVGFAIGGDLHAQEIAVVHSSGYASLDRAAARAVADAGELPAIYGRLVIPVTFSLTDR